MKNTRLHKWKIMDSCLAFDHQWYKVRQDKVKIAPGKILNDYFLGVFPNIVLVVAVTKDGKIPMVRQYKHGAGEILLEVPAGYVDKGETPLRAAKRELLEETGYAAKKWKQLGFFYSNPTKEKGNGIYIFFAEHAKRVRNPKGDDTETIQVFLLTKKEALKKILNNRIKVAGSAIALLLALQNKNVPR